jgi:hypothetical protein
MKPDMRISIKDYRRNKNLKIQLIQVPFSASRQFWVQMISGQLPPVRGQESREHLAEGFS